MRTTDIDIIRRIIDLLTRPNELDVEHQVSLHSFAKVLDLASQRSICNHGVSLQVDLRNLLENQLEIAFEELKTANGWTWGSFQELQSVFWTIATKHQKVIFKNCCSV